jgi:putative transposase
LSLRWLTQLRSNRLVNPDRMGNRAVRECAIAETGTIVHLKDYGMVKVFRIVTPAGDTEYWATNDLEMGELARLKDAEMAWGIAVYHRALKQECGVERAMVRAGRAQRNHIGCAIRAFVRLEWHRLRTGIGWTLAKEGIIRAARRRYLAHPWYTLPASA